MSCAPNPQDPPLSAAQKLQLETLRGQLMDPTRRPQTREDAARLLLNQDYPQADRALSEVLSEAGEAGAQIAVANAIADAGNADTEFINPLLTMLTGEDPAVRDAAARALVTYQNHGVTGRLVRIAEDRSQDREVRLTVVASLGRIVAKPSVQALVKLLHDPSPEIRAAAAKSLARLTNIRSYGTDASLWEAWWARNRDKPQTAWLAELAESVTRAQMNLEQENRQLRERLVKVMTDLYNATPKTQRPTMLLEMYVSPISDIRLLAARLTDKMIATNEPVGPDIRQRVRAAIDDADPRVRELAALLEASLPDAQTPELLLARLEEERSPRVRAGILKALGQLKTAQAIPAILKKLPSQDVTEATAAAEALTRIVAEQPLTGEARSRAANALAIRYSKARASGNDEKLREALLRAMGMVAEPSLAPGLIEALDDPAGTIRLAALTGLTRLRTVDAIGAIEPLLGDPDRGVRQAALAAVARLGGQQFLPTLLTRTDPETEADATVRRQAWAEVFELAQQADAEALARVLKALDTRDDARNERINIMTLRVEALRESESAELPEALLQLVTALRQADRAAEAVPLAAEVVTLLEADDSAPGQGSPWRRAWLVYVAALLEANDPAFANVLADGPHEKMPTLATEAVDMLFGRLATLREAENHLAVIALSDAALTELTDYLAANQRQQLRAMLKAALTAQADIDHDTVVGLLPALLAAEAATRTQASSQLQTMGDRAVRPLVEALRGLLAAEEPDEQLEAAIAEILKQVAPKLGPYDPAAPPAQKRQLVAGWLEQL
jgi:HEAT repeat protein